MAKRYIEFTKQERDYVMQNYLSIPVKRLASDLGMSQGRVTRFFKRNDLFIPREIIEQRKRDSWLKKGHVAHNKGRKQKDYMSPENIAKSAKTRFKKGSTPPNTKPVGSERVTKDGYVEKKFKDIGYRLKHLHLWEQLNGKLPDGHCLECQDGNKQNTDPSNWKLISRIESMYKHSHANYPEEIIPSLVLTRKITKIIENGK